MQAPGPGRQPWEQTAPRGREGGRAGRAGGAPPDNLVLLFWIINSPTPSAARASQQPTNLNGPFVPHVK